MIALYATWVIILLLAVVLFIYGKKDFTSPAFFMALGFFACFTVVVCNVENWDIALHGYYWETTFCILAAIISFSFGCFIISSASNRNHVNEATVQPKIEYRSENYPYFSFCILSVVLFVLFLKYKIGSFSLSSMTAFSDALRGNYTAKKEYNIFTTQILEALVGLAYISFHRAMIERYYLRKKIHISLFLPIVLFLFGTLLYTDRNIFLRFMVFCLAAFVMSFNWKGITARNNRKLIVRVSIAVVLIAVVFWYYGHLKKYTSNLERMVGIYAGSGLYGFNLWLHGFDHHYTYGAFMFSSVLNTLHAFGIGHGGNYSQEAYEYIIYTSRNGYVFATNIYSALRVYYQDLGITGIIAVAFPMGMVFEKIYQLAVKRKYGFWWLFYCAHIYHILYFPILEQFLLRFHLGLLYEIFWLWFFYYLVYGKYGLWRFKLKCNQVRLCKRTL